MISSYKAKPKLDLTVFDSRQCARMNVSVSR